MAEPVLVNLVCHLQPPTTSTDKVDTECPSRIVTRAAENNDLKAVTLIEGPDVAIADHPAMRPALGRVQGFLVC